MGATANVFSTRYNGTIRFECSGGQIKVNAERNTTRMRQKLIDKATSKTRNLTITFNAASPVRMTDSILDTSKYYNRQLAESGSSKSFTGIWKNAGGHSFLRTGNVYAWNTFADKDGKTYYFGKNKRRVTGFVNAYGRRYYFDPYMVTGWKTIAGRRYYFLDKKCSSYTEAAKGAMAQGFKTISGRRYYFMDGSCLTYSAEDHGRRMLGFFTAAGRTYYAQDNRMEGYEPAELGVIQKGFKKIDGNLYYLGTNGVLRTGWFEAGKNRYYAFEDGRLASGEVTIGSVVYEFDTIENGCALIGAK